MLRNVPFLLRRNASGYHGRSRVIFSSNKSNATLLPNLPSLQKMCEGYMKETQLGGPGLIYGQNLTPKLSFLGCKTPSCSVMTITRLYVFRMSKLETRRIRGITRGAIHVSVHGRGRSGKTVSMLISSYTPTPGFPNQRIPVSP